MAGIERWFLRIALGVSAVAWLALVLAEFGRFRIELLLALLLTVAIGLALLAYAFFAPPPPATRARSGALPPILEFGALLLLAAWLFLPPYEAVVAGGDATVYLNFGRRIASTGTLEFEDGLVSRLPADIRAELFENRRPSDATGRYARFPGGFRIPDIVDPTVTAGFSPLFPVLAALFHEVASLRGSLFVAPLFATLSIGSLFLVAAHIGGRRAGWLTAALTLAALPQLWFARLPVPEMVAQYFVLTGLLAWLVARRDDARRWAVAAGWLFGVACFAKVDLIVLLSISLLAFSAWRLLARPDRGTRGVGCLLVSFGLLLIHNGAHYLAFDSHYRPYIEYLIRTSYLGALWRQAGPTATLAAAAAGLFAAGLVWVACRCSPWTRRRACGAVLAGIVSAYAVNYAAITNARFDETVVWLSWYVSWPVLILAALGLAGRFGAGLAGRGGGDHGSGLAFVLLTVVGLHYLYDPLEPGVHVWSMRRFTPVVLPLLMLVVSTAVAALVGRIALGYRRIVAVGVAAALVGLVVRPSLAVVGKPLWDGALAQTDVVAGLFPARAVVLMSPGLAGTHVPTSLAYLHDLDTVLVQGSPGGGRRSSSIARAVHFWLARGRPVFFVFSDRDFFSFFAPEFSLTGIGRAHIDLLMLEQTRTRAPQDAVRPPIRLRVFQVRRTDTVPVAVDVGDPAADVFFGLEGFHAAERDGWGDGTFRWSSERASFTIPAGVHAALTVAGGRPAGAPPAALRVWMGDELVVERRVLGDEPQVIVLGAPAASGSTRLTIESTTFQPRALGISADARILGVKLYRVTLDARALPELQAPRGGRGAP